MEHIALIVDDDRSERRLISGIIRRKIDMECIETENGHTALQALEAPDNKNIRLVILDLNMPVLGGMETLKAIKKKNPSLPVLILTGDTDMSVAIDAIKSGASDFLTKPVTPERLEVSITNALKMSLMNREISKLKRLTDQTLLFSDLIGSEGSLKTCVQAGRKAAACALPVLITGETGTGKEMFARAVHGESRRADKPFIALNCGAMPEKLVESTLFGHEKGSFTGATSKTPGKFLEADGGTIFLDEIGELPLEAQVKLLRVLQQKEVEPVGAARPVPVDVRIISATNRDLIEEVRENRFREDLYFRLNILQIDLPPLRKRKTEIELMARYFIQKFCSSHSVPPRFLNPQALEKLRQYDWPGNIRQFENAINRAMVMSETERLEPEDITLMPEISEREARLSPPGILSTLHNDGSFKSLRELEQEIINMALTHHNHNFSQTARTLGIAKSTLYARVHAEIEAKSA